MSPKPGVLWAHSSPLTDPGTTLQAKEGPHPSYCPELWAGGAHRAGGGSAPLGDVGWRVRGTGCCSPTGAPQPPPISLDMDDHTSCTDCCQATAGVARRPVARRRAGTPPRIPLPQHPSRGPGECRGVAGRAGRLPTTAWPYCHSRDPPLPHPTQLWVRHHPWDPQHLTLRVGHHLQVPQCRITLLCQGGVEAPVPTPLHPAMEVTSPVPPSIQPW